MIARDDRLQHKTSNKNVYIIYICTSKAFIFQYQSTIKMAHLNANMFVSPVHSLSLTSVHLSIHNKNKKKGGKKKKKNQYFIKINILIFFFFFFAL